MDTYYIDAPEVSLGPVPQTDATGGGIGWILVSLMALTAVAMTGRKRKFAELL